MATNASGNLNAQLEFTPSLTGDYYVVAAGATDYDGGVYEISVASAAAPDIANTGGASKTMRRSG